MQLQILSNLVSIEHIAVGKAEALNAAGLRIRGWTAGRARGGQAPVGSWVVVGVTFWLRKQYVKRGNLLEYLTHSLA